MKRLLSLALPLLALAACSPSTSSYCANWSCGGSSQCASDMGGPSGSQCGFTSSSACQAWCQSYIPGNCSCGGGGGGAPPVLSYLTVTPGNAVLAIGATQQYTATGHYSDGSSADVTAQASWSVVTVSGSGVASITSGGLVTALALGTATVTATQGGHSASTALGTSPKAITSIDVAPPNPTIAKGQTQSFTATAHWTDGTTTDVTSTAGWSSGPTSVATMSGAVATAVGTGTATIAAYLGGKTGSTVLTVIGAALVSVAIRPATPEIAAGFSRQLTAIGTYSDGSAQDLTATATWASNVTSVATIGAPGVANAVAPGTAVVSASFPDAQGLATVTVTSAALQTVSVSPPTPSLGPGETLTLSAIGAFSDGTSYPIPAGVTWASDAPATVSIDATSGIASTFAAGTANVSATVAGIPGSTPVTVSSSPPGTNWAWHATGITEPTGIDVSAGSYYLNAIVWTGSQLIAAGSYGQILTSPDGLAWTYHPRTGTMRVSGFAYAPELGLVVGATTNGMWTSPDGITWTQTLSSNGLSAVAWSGTLLVAVGSHVTGNSLVYTSPDGVTWTQRNPGTGQVLDSVIWNGAQFVAVGNATVASADGVHWALSPDTSNAASGIAWSGKTFVKVATSGGVRTSPDGLNWTLVATLPVTLNDVIWADNRFVIVGGPGNTMAAFTSPDGVSWTQRTIGIAGILGAPVLNAVAWTGTRLVAVGTYVNPVNPADGNYSIEISP